jgi:hypothetical protein
MKEEEAESYFSSFNGVFSLWVTLMYSELHHFFLAAFGPLSCLSPETALCFPLGPSPSSWRRR